MSFLDLLHTVGGRLGILETSPNTSAGECIKVVTRTVTLDELTSEIRSEKVRNLAELHTDLAISFDKIFEAAGIPAPVHGWNVDRLQSVLRADAYQKKDRAAAQLDLLTTLRSESVQSEELVREAVARDQALDSYETHLRKKVDEHISEFERQIITLDARIQALQSERARLGERTLVESEKLREWIRRKRAYERDLASAIGFLTERPVISTEETTSDE